MISEQQYDRYVHYLLKGDRRSCELIVTSLLEKEITVRILYTELFQRSMYRVGELWETNKVTVAVEHLATSITQQLMTLVYPQVFSVEKHGKKAVVACVASEYHELGSRMVADVFELNHWDGYFLGSNTPINDLVQYIKEVRPTVLCLSLSIYFNIPELIKTIEGVQRQNPDLPIIVGGQAFRWGGEEIMDQFPNVQLVSSLERLELMINEGEI